MGGGLDQSKNALIIFIKNPIAGRVKTRLAATIGNVEALKVYHKLLDITKLASLSAKARKYLFYSHFIDENDAWPNTHFLKKLQTGENLGARMQSAFELALKDHEKVIIIGSDCPTLKGTDINGAFEHLDSYDVVFGPSEDGGYYLLGIKKMHSFLFIDLPWSTNKLLDLSLKRCKQQGVTYDLIRTQNDIDAEKDIPEGF